MKMKLLLFSLAALSLNTQILVSGTPDISEVEFPAPDPTVPDALVIDLDRY